MFKNIIYLFFYFKRALIRDNLLIIPHVQLEDEGEYQCVATNQLSSIESKAFLVINERPKFIKTMSNLTIGIDSKSIILECNARGKPQPVIYWAKSNTKPQNYDTSSTDPSLPSSEMTVTQDDFLILENGNLFIERLSRKYEGTYLCQASNEYGNIETKTYLKVKPIQSKPPPIIIYGPQNQTIPINTQANLECLASMGLNIINKDSSFKHQRPFNIQNAYSNDKITITWYKGTQEIISTPFNVNGRFKIAESGALEISAVQKIDTGVYKCVATNGYGRTTSMPALLTVENPNNQYVEFQRAYESTTLPSAPTQPIISSITSNSLVISWQPSSHSGHSPLKSYTIEYFSPEWPVTTGWTILADNVLPVNSFLIENLQSDTYYMFIVRARNEQGFGPPSQVSDLVKTLVETQILLRNKDSNDLLEKALTGEIIQLNEQPDILSSSSINITWKIYKSAFLIEGIYLKYKPIGVKDYQIEVLNEKNPNYVNRANYYVIKNLNKFTTYEILLEPYIGELKGSESNVIQVKTKEDIPSQIPLNLQADIETLNSISIKWQPPLQQHMNGIIMGYKIMCLANETKYGINLNTNGSSRAIILGNLIHGMRYCVKVAAFTKVGTGPFSPPKCIDMTEENLAKTKENNNSQKNKINQQYSVPVTFNDKLRFLMKQSWFISLLTIVCILAACLIFYCLWMSLRRLFVRRDKKHQKYLSSSENCSSLNLGNHKIDANGNRYKLVNDTIWLDTMYSSSKNSNQDCCCVPDIPHQLFLHNNNGNLQLINNNQLSTLDRRNIHNMSLNSKSIKISNNVAPQYAEIYAAALQQQQGANPYATTGLFMNGTTTTTTDSENAYNICDDMGGGETQVFLEKTNSNVINSPANLRATAAFSHLNPKYSSYTLKVIDDSSKLIRNDLDLANKLVILNAVPSNQSNNSILINDQKKLIKYLQATQSQTNTPRIQLKNMQNRVKSVEQQQQQQQQQQILDYQNQVNSLNTFLASNNNGNNSYNNNSISQNSGVPSLPSVPPPSLSTAFMTAQQELLNSSVNNGTQSPVLYNAPWNVGPPNENNLNSILLTHLIQNNPNANSTQIPKVYQMNTLSSSTFTSQQYANNRRNDNKQQKEPQTDYLSISPDEDEYEEDISSNNTNSYYPIQSPHQKFILATAASANGTKIKITNQKPIQLINQPTTGSAGSYDSSTNQNTCSSSDSSILSASKHSANQSNNDYHIVYSDQLNNQLV